MLHLTEAEKTKKPKNQGIGSPACVWDFPKEHPASPSPLPIPAGLDVLLAPVCVLGFFKSTVWLFRGLLRGDQRGNVPPGHRPRHAEQYFQGQLPSRDSTRLLRVLGVCPGVGLLLE